MGIVPPNYDFCLMMMEQAMKTLPVWFLAFFFALAFLLSAYGHHSPRYALVAAGCAAVAVTAIRYMFPRLGIFRSQK
ncbi:MAG: hypothetical protein JSR81_04315 [Proteobacteria bacterium]|nr:hypothetical protein [Pseudomonadota bacterium]